MDPQEGDIADLPDGRTAVYSGGRWVVQGGGAPSPAPSAGGYSIVPMTTPAERRAMEDQQFQREDRLYTRERNEASDARAAAREERAIAAAERQAEQLTEGQSKALQYGTMMRGAEADYQAARAAGYDPGSFRNRFAEFASLIPWDQDIVGRAIRDDLADRGFQAERRWAEANLRQLTGAAASDPEITRVQAINFDRANDDLSEQRFRTRRDTYGATRLAAGNARDRLPEDYPDGYFSNPLDENGLPVYNGPVGENREAVAAVPGDQAPPPAAPGAGPQGPVDISGMSAAELLQLQPGTEIRLPDGTVTRLTGAPSIGAQGEEVAPGVFTRETPQDVIEARRGSGEGVGRKIDAAVRGAADTITFGLADEIAAGANSIIPLDRGSRSIWTDGADAYQNNLAIQRGVDAADAEQVPVSRAAGQVAGGLTAGAGVVRAVPAAGRFVAGGASRLARAGRAAGAGAAYGGAYGFGAGEGNALERLDDAAIGGAIGAGAGVAAPVVGNALAAVARPVVAGAQAVNRGLARPVVNALGDRAPTALREAVAPNPLASGMARFANRSPQDVNALNANVARFREETIEPTFADAVNDGGRGTMRALATRQTPARQQAREFAESRAAGLQDRVSTQARRTLSDDPRQPAQIREEITTRRNAQADQAFGAVRGEALQPEREIIEALRAPALRPAIEEAATSALNRGDSETANLLRQLSDGALDNPNGVQITVGMADRLARSLNGRAEAFQRSGNNDQASAYFALAERLRGGARRQVPGYDEALQGYAADSRLAQATELGEQFMSMEADQFAAAVNALSPEERQLARAAARRAVERQAGTQGQAPGVAQRLSTGREQAARTQALVGDAAPVQRAMGAELQALRNAQGVSPAQGSPTSMNAQDAMNAAGMVRDVATLNVPGLASRAMNAIRSRGFSDAEAQAIVEAAIDPAQTDRLVTMLAERMNRREARNLARAIRYQLTTGPQSGRQE